MATKIAPKAAKLDAPVKAEDRTVKFGVNTITPNKCYFLEVDDTTVEVIVPGVGDKVTVNIKSDVLWLGRNPAQTPLCLWVHESKGGSIAIQPKGDGFVVNVYKKGCRSFIKVI